MQHYSVAVSEPIYIAMIHSLYHRNASQNCDMIFSSHHPALASRQKYLREKVGVGSGWGWGTNFFFNKVERILIQLRLIHKAHTVAVKSLDTT